LSRRGWRYLPLLFRHPSPPSALNAEHPFENKFKQPQNGPWSVEAEFPKQEVADAIAAVTAFLDLVAKK